MVPCKECPNIEECHKEDIGELQIMRELDEALRLRKLVEAEEWSKKLWRRLRERHQRLTGR